VGDIPMGSESTCMSPHACHCSLMSIGLPRIMSVLMQVRFHKLGGVPSMSQCNRDLVEGEVLSSGDASCIYVVRTDVSMSEM
jgi:hypothetical protein